MFTKREVFLRKAIFYVCVSMVQRRRNKLKFCNELFVFDNKTDILTKKINAEAWNNFSEICITEWILLGQVNKIFLLARWFVSD